MTFLHEGDDFTSKVSTGVGVGVGVGGVLTSENQPEKQLEALSYMMWKFTSA